MPLKPVQVIRRTTSNVEQIRADIDAFFINARFDILPDERRARRRTHTSLVMGDIRIEEFEPVGGELSGVGGAFYHIGYVSKGGIRVKRRKIELYSAPGGIGTLDAPGRPFSLVTTLGTIGRMLVVPPAVLETAGRTMPGEKFKLDDQLSVDMRSPAGRAVVRNTSAIFQELGQLEKMGLSHLATQSFCELLINLTIASMRPELFAEEEGRLASSSSVVAKAVEIIRTRAHEPLSIRDVAVEVGVTVRSLQIGFRRQLGVTPMQFLLHRRLILARERLLNPEFGGNVQFVAMSCGFMNMSRFSTRYREAFGELPSETLVRGRRG